MSDKTPPIVIHGPAWARGKLAAAIATLVLIVLGWVLYAWGGLRAGHDALAAARTQLGLRTDILARDLEIRRLERVVAEYEVQKAGLQRERQEVSRTIGELQAEVARQKQQLEFYRGIVIKGSERIDVAIRELRVAPGASSGRYVVRLSLEQPGKSQGAVTGVAKFTVDGLQAGRAAQVVGPETAYNFRYFSALQPELVLPVGFTPQRLTVELRAPDRPEVLVTRTMVLAVDGG